MEYTTVKQALDQLHSLMAPPAAIVDAMPENKQIAAIIDNGTKKYPMNYNLRIKIALPVA